MEEKELKEEYNKHKSEIEAKLQEFFKLASKEHIKELFFCILTPQSNAEKCWQAVQELEKCKSASKNVEECLKTRTRFYKNKTRYILEANKKWESINKLINNTKDAIKIRNLLTDNNSQYRIKGLGMKEASHFLRNIGKSNNELAILDRHVLSQLKKLSIITEEVKLNNKNYIEIENKMKEFAKSVNIPLDNLDLLFWKLESGRIFK